MVIVPDETQKIDVAPVIPEESDEIKESREHLPPPFDVDAAPVVPDEPAIEAQVIAENADEEGGNISDVPEPPNPVIPEAIDVPAPESVQQEVQAIPDVETDVNVPVQEVMGV